MKVVQGIAAARGIPRGPAFQFRPLAPEIKRRVVAELERACEAITRHLAQGVTPQQEQSITDFAENVGKGLEVAGDNFEVRRQIIEALDVRVVLAVWNQKKTANVSCVLGENVLELVANRKKGADLAGTLQSASKHYSTVVGGNFLSIMSLYCM